MKKLLLNTLITSSILLLLFSCSSAPSGCLNPKSYQELAGTFTVTSIEEILSPNATCQNGVIIKGMFKSDSTTFSASDRTLYFDGNNPAKEWVNRKGVTLGKEFKVKMTEGGECNSVERFIASELKDTDYCK